MDNAGKTSKNLEFFFLKLQILFPTAQCFLNFITDANLNVELYWIGVDTFS